MDNIDAVSTDYHLDKTTQVKREVWDLTWDIEPHLKKTLIEKLDSLPTLEIKKSDLGEQSGLVRLNSNEAVQLQPTIRLNEDNDQTELCWNIQNKDKVERERETPKITAETVTSKNIRSYEESLPRTYRGVDDEREKAWIFRNDEGKPAGWVVVREHGKGAHVGFIGVSVDFESGGYGTSIINFLKEKYDDLSLSMLAYDTAGRGYNNASERLARFYMRNGFYTTDGGSLAWDKNVPNLETTSGQMLVKDAVVAQGDIYSVNNLLDTYLNKLVTTPNFKDALSEKEQTLIKSWIELRKEGGVLEKESDTYRRSLQHYEHLQRMAEYDRTESVGIGG